MSQNDCEKQVKCPLGMAVVPRQTWGELYDLKMALQNGTIFKELNLPFFIGGGIDGN
jgi:hypothetical protein